MTNSIQTHILSFKNDIYILGISLMLGVGINTVLSFYINNKVNYMIKDNNDKEELLLKKLEKIQVKCSVLNYEREQLLDTVLSFKSTINDLNKATEIPKLEESNNNNGDYSDYVFYDMISRH